MGEPVKIPILGVGRFAGLKREYSVEYSIGSAGGSACGSARLGLTARIWRAWTALVVYLCCAWSNSSESSGGACGSPRCPINLIFATVSSYGCDLHCGMIKTCFGQP